MMRCLVAIFLSFFLAMPVNAGMCDEANTMIERTFDWDFQNGFLESISLPWVQGGVAYPSPVQLHLGTDGRPELFGSYVRDAGVGWEYNLFRLQIQIGEGPDAQWIDQDYTFGCTEVPIGLGAGSTLQLVPVKLAPHADGSPLGVERVRVRFWGR